MASAVTLLPLPDSPTMPSVRPGSTSRSMPRSAGLRPAAVRNLTWRSRIASSGAGVGHGMAASTFQNSIRLSLKCLNAYLVRTSFRRCNSGTSPSHTSMT